MSDPVRPTEFRGTDPVHSSLHRLDVEWRSEHLRWNAKAHVAQAQACESNPNTCRACGMSHLVFVTWETWMNLDEHGVHLALFDTCAVSAPFARFGHVLRDSSRRCGRHRPWHSRGATVSHTGESSDGL